MVPQCAAGRRTAAGNPPRRPDSPAPPAAGTRSGTAGCPSRDVFPGRRNMSDNTQRPDRRLQPEEISMFSSIIRSTVAVALTAAAVIAAQPEALAQADQQKLVGEAQKTFSNFVRDPDMKWFQQNVGRAKAVLIAPEVLKAGFIFGGSGGRAVLIAKDPKSGKWVGPAFYALATASVGFQAGVSVSEAITLVMTDKGMNSLLSPSFKMGGDASVAAGPVGAGASSNVVADLIAFARAKGVYGGLNLDGTVVNTSDDWNEAYYGKKVMSPDILVRMSVQNKGADALLAEITKAAGGK
jgi:SH3 domain-containing YSC84-like protein 1